LKLRLESGSLNYPGVTCDWGNSISLPMIDDTDTSNERVEVSSVRV
jgi:hypothetical protein